MIYGEIKAERDRQDRKWGEQNHSMVQLGDAAWAAAVLGVPHASFAKDCCDMAASDGSVTFGHILVEEVAEAFEAAAMHGDASDELRAELVQVAAVAVAMIDRVDRIRAGAK